MHNFTEQVDRFEINFGLKLKHLSDAIIQSLCNINKYLQKNFRSTLENQEKCDHLAFLVNGIEGPTTLVSGSLTLVCAEALLLAL